jgi:hypothetical protein
MKKINILIIILMISLYSCVYDSQSEICVVKNVHSNTLLIGYRLDKLMSDSILYNERFGEILIHPQEFKTIALVNKKLSSMPNSANCYIYLLNYDSLLIHQKQKAEKGVLTSALIKTVKIQLNTLKTPLDTIN